MAVSFMNMIGFAALAMGITKTFFGCLVTEHQYAALIG